MHFDYHFITEADILHRYRGNTGNEDKGELSYEDWASYVSRDTSTPQGFRENQTKMNITPQHFSGVYLTRPFLI